MITLGVAMALPSFGQNMKPFIASRNKTTKAKSADNSRISVIADENFDKFTAGSLEKPDSKNVAGAGGGDYRMKPGYMNLDGWRGVHIYQAGGAAYLREFATTYSTDYGYLSLPYMEMYGTVTVTCRARKGLKTTKDTGLTFVLADSVMAVLDSKTYPLTDDWQNITYETSLATFSQYNQIQFQAFKGEVFIDDIKVVRNRNTAAPPTALQPVNISTTDFLAKWLPAPHATAYLLTVYYKEMPANPVPITTVTEHFDDIKADAMGKIDATNPNYPQGWQFGLSKKGNQEISTAANTYISGKQSIVFDAEGDDFYTPEMKAPISSLRFWVKPTTTERQSDVYTLFSVRVKYADGTWKRIANIPNTWLEDEGLYYELKGDELGENVVQAHFEFLQRSEAINFYFDDFSITYGSQPVPFKHLDAVRVEANELEYEVTDLDEEKEYYYYVQSVDGDLISAPSNDMWVDGILGLKPTALPATNIKDNSFTANWERNSNADSYVFQLYKTSKSTKAQERITLLKEDFSGINEGTPQTPAEPKMYTPLLDLSRQGFAKTNWTAEYPMWAKGMIGTKDTYEWFDKLNFIISPAMPIRGGLGTEVKFSACPTVDNDSIWVLVMANPKDLYVNLGYKIPLDVKAHETKEVTLFIAEEHMTEMLEKGKDYYLVFASNSSKGFFLDKIEAARITEGADEEVTELMEISYPTENRKEVTGLESGANYGYKVKAYRNKNFLEYTSDNSNLITVITTKTSIDQKTIGRLEIEPMGNGLVQITSNVNDQLVVYNLAGQTVLSKAMTQGKNTISLTPGAYLFRIGGKTARIIID